MSKEAAGAGGWGRDEWAVHHPVVTRECSQGQAGPPDDLFPLPKLN